MSDGKPDLESDLERVRIFIVTQIETTDIDGRGFTRQGQPTQPILNALDRISEAIKKTEPQA